MGVAQQRDYHGPIVIAIEAKADEEFGKELADQYRRARANRYLPSTSCGMRATTYFSPSTMLERSTSRL